MLALVVGIVAFGGVVKGLAGFGYGIAGTALLATVLDPADAVVLMILPTLAANLSLLRELDRDGIRSCLVEFGPYIGAAVVGTLLGMVLLDSVPQRLLAMVLVGVSGVRVAAAFGLGLYGGGTLSLSALAVVPGPLGVTLGGLGRRYVSDWALMAGTLVLLLVIGVRLTTKGVGL